MGSKTRLRSYCTKRGDDTLNLVTSRKTIARLARPMINDGRFANVAQSMTVEVESVIDLHATGPGFVTWKLTV